MITNEWRKSSYSAMQDCVEVRLEDERVAVRDSKNPDGPQLHLERTEWQTFLKEINA